MSRVPRPAASSTSLRGQYKIPTSSPKKSTTTLPVKARQATGATPRATPSKASATTLNANKGADGRTSPVKERMSLKEQIALKRAEVKKAQTQANGGNTEDIFDGPGLSLIGTPARAKKEEEDIVEIGRWSIRETVERARSTGVLNVSARSLVCIPSCLFEVHLGVTPIALTSVSEPDYPEEISPKKLKQGRQQPSWFEAQDLVVLKARSNEIVELQPELSLFGSLKTIDLHSNLLRALPESLTVLSMLTVLDVSNNKLTEFPPSLFSLTSLTTLDISHNELTSLPFTKFNAPLRSTKSIATGGFFEPEIKRAEAPLPKLHILNASYNKLLARAIDHGHLPSAMRQVDLAHNPLGDASDLLSALAMLNDLQGLSLNGADVGDESIKHLKNVGFPTLINLDFGETRITEQGVRDFFSGSRRESKLNFNISTAPPIPGELRVVVGKQVIREQWEIEAEQRYLRKKKSMVSIHSDSKDNENYGHRTVPAGEKEPWEVEAEQGLLTEGGRRRARLTTTPAVPDSTSVPRPKQTVTRPKVIEKEAWEIEAEQGLLTEGGRRRLRAQQAAAASPSSPEKETASSATSSATSSLANSTYYAPKEHSLTLPPSAPPNRGHARAFSLVASRSQSKSEDLHVPSPTLPLNVIALQNFASTLRVLTLKNRRADPTFSFPLASLIDDASSSGGVLPRLDELNLEGCSLSDTVTVTQEQEAKFAPPTAQKQNLLEAISIAFPSLTILDLSYNTISSDLLNEDTVKKLLLSSDGELRKGLRVLRLRGNRLSHLDGLDTLAARFRGNRQVPEWKLEELDVRDNNISKLPVNLGLLPLDVFLVDGNTFRVPPRKVWEREGTKGLLSWLRSRID